LTMVTTVVPPDRARRFGNVEVDAEGRVRRFVYKPDDPVSDVVTTEVFVFDGPSLLEAVNELASGAGDGDVELEDFGDDLIPHLVDHGEVREHRFSGYWRDVGTLDSYWRSHMELLDRDPLLRLDDPSWPVLTAAATRPPARCFGSAWTDNALLSPGCVVRGRVEHSVLAPGVVVEEGANVRDSVLLHDTVVEAGASVSGAICDMRVRIGGHARVGQADGAGNARSDDDLVVLGGGVEIADGAEVAPGARQGGGGRADGGG
ncbi:MAG: sugar phosphate nucleotidyltransferase, partial [Actinomycetota bacterium]|nr:sugar phosphate nucleotidyltransferase [Actinomycetota bacterium]